MNNPILTKKFNKNSNARDIYGVDLLFNKILYKKLIIAFRVRVQLVQRVSKEKADYNVACD